VAANTSRPLSDVQPGRYRIIQVRDQDASFLEWMGQSGLRPGSFIAIRETDPASGVLALDLENDGEKVSIAVDAARKIRVEPYAGS